jgi:hypothetical protein
MIGNGVVNWWDWLGLDCNNYCDNLRKAMESLLGAMQTDVDSQRNAAEAARTLNTWQYGRAVGDILSAGYGAVSGILKSSSAAARTASSVAKRAGTSIAKNVKNAKTGKSFVSELSKNAYRGAYTSTAVAEVAKDRVQDAAIKNTAEALKSDDNLSNQSNGDMLMDSVLGGDDTFNGLTDLADDAGRSYDRLNNAYNKLKKRYRKCCR